MVEASDVQRLRRATGAGMMDAKRALEDAGGDFERAKELLRERGIADVRKRSNRARGEGTIGHYLHYQAERPVIGVLVELASETDFVAKSADFRSAADDIAMHVAASRPEWVNRTEVPEGVLQKEKDLLAAQARQEGKPDDVIDKIVDGRLNVFFADHVLYDQAFVNPGRFDGTVAEMVEQLSATVGENVGVTRFVRLQVGEQGGG